MSPGFVGNHAISTVDSPTAYIPAGRARLGDLQDDPKAVLHQVRDPEGGFTKQRTRSSGRLSRTGKVRKGTNESTKAIERGLAKLVVIAEDVQPPEVVAHLPILCEERKIPYVFVPSKDQIGPAIGIDVSTASAAVLDAGEGAQILEQVTQELARLKKTA